MWQITPYRSEFRAEWDDMVRRSRNGTMLALRGYMDYHADRFEDASLMVRDRHGHLRAILPANREDEGKRICSHRGLTYGGWITPCRHFNADTMLDIWDTMTDYYRAEGAEQLVYRPVPWIYATMPADDDLYALFRHDARITGCNVSTAIPLDTPPLLNESTRQSLRDADKSHIEICESENFGLFWDMLTKVLAERHDTKPTHTLAEIELLHSRFPDSIRLILASMPDGETVAGAVVYVDRTVLHTQYLAATPVGREHKALVPLICGIPQFEWAGGRRYLDFGSSCEDSGRYLNRGLLLQKAGLGGRTVACNEYTVDLR